MTVKVRNLNDAKLLAEACNLCNCSIDASTGSRFCDAKSVLGIMTLDLSSDIKLTFNCADYELQRNITLVSEYYKVR